MAKTNYLIEKTARAVIEYIQNKELGYSVRAKINAIIDSLKRFATKEDVEKIITPYFETEIALNLERPNAPEGSKAWVGESYPGTTWVVKNGKWEDTGIVPPAEEVNLAEYIKKEEIQTQINHEQKPITSAAVSSELLTNNLIFLDALLTKGAIRFNGTTDGTDVKYMRSATLNNSTYHIQKGKKHYYTGSINSAEYCGVIYLTETFQFIGYQCAGIGDYVKFELTIPSEAIYLAACSDTKGYSGEPLIQCEADISRITKVSDTKAEKSDVLSQNIATSLLFSDVAESYSDALPYIAYELETPKADVGYISQVNSSVNDTISQNAYVNNWVSYFSTINHLKANTKAVVLNVKVLAMHGVSAGVGIAISDTKSIIYTYNGAIVEQSGGNQNVLSSNLANYSNDDALSFIVDIKDSSSQVISIYKNSKLIFSQKLSDGFMLKEDNNIGYSLRGVATVEFEKIKLLKINFNSAHAQEGVSRVEWKYNNVDHPTTRIAQYTVVPDLNPDNNQIAGNTGLGYNPLTREFVVGFYNYQYSAKLWVYKFKDLIEYKDDVQLLPKPTKEIDVSNYLYHIQGCDYDSDLNCYWILGGMSAEATDNDRLLIAVNDNGDLLDYYPLTEYTVQVGMLVVYKDSIYIKPNNARWLLEINKSTKEVVRQASTIYSYNEGLGINKFNGNVWLGEDNGAIIEYSNDLQVILGNYQNITFGNQVEGLVIDPADDTVWINADTYLHGENQNGNGLWHADFKKTYNKFIRFPEAISWNVGKLSGGLKIENNRLVGSGSWESPILDFSNYEDYKNNIPQLTANTDVVIQYRGSDSMPDRLISGDRVNYFLDWGSIIPSEYSENRDYKYVQIMLIIY